MEIKKEVELYLQTCGEPHMGVDSFRAIQPGEICWLIVHPHWRMLDYLYQTITLSGNFLILESWHEVTEDGEKPLLSECLSIATTLTELHLRLADMADQSSRRFLASLISTGYWHQEDADRLIAKMSSSRKNKALELLDYLRSDIEKLKKAIATKVPIEDLIALSENLDKLSEDLNRLR